MTTPTPTHANSFKYDITYKIAYDTDDEYRQCIQSVFGLEMIATETEDEIIYDMDSLSIACDNIFKATKDLSLFHNIYKKAALLMVSEEPSVGLAIMFSFDYFAMFHPCVVALFTGPNGTINESVLNDAMSTIDIALSSGQNRNKVKND